MAKATVCGCVYVCKCQPVYLIPYLFAYFCTHVTTLITTLFFTNSLLITTFTTALIITLYKPIEAQTTTEYIHHGTIMHGMQSSICS